MVALVSTIHEWRKKIIPTIINFSTNSHNKLQSLPSQKFSEPEINLLDNILQPIKLLFQCNNGIHRILTSSYFAVYQFLGII